MERAWKFYYDFARNPLSIILGVWIGYEVRLFMFEQWGIAKITDIFTSII